MNTIQLKHFAHPVVIEHRSSKHLNSVIPFFITKPTSCTNFPNLFWHETLRVSGSSSAHHQEFIHCALGTGMCHAGLKTAFEQDQRNCPKHVEFHAKINLGN
jgi:hypothetical protein